MLRATVDPRLCIGSSNCAEEAPDAFYVDERGLARLVSPQAPDDAVLRGARACPVDAIRVTDMDGRGVHPETPLRDPR